MTREPSRRFDVLLAAAAAVFCLSGAAIVGASKEPDLTLLGGVVLSAQCIPLAFRRRWPIPIWAATGVAAMVYGIVDWPDPLFPVGAFLGLATVVECCSRRTALFAWLVSASVTVTTLIVSGDSDALDVWVSIVMLLAAPLLGDHQRSRSAYLAELRAGADRAELDHRREVRAAQLAERAHLARELHDVVAHHVSMIVVQAEAGASASTTDAVPSSEAFDAIASTGRRALGELRTLLGVLRTDATQHAPTAPQAGLDQIDELVHSIEMASLHVDVTIEGAERRLAPAVDLSAYRIVQEGLTNVVKHAGATKASVSIRYEPDRVRITVTDDGNERRVNTSNAASHSGHGLVGLRERASLLHGTLTAGRVPAGGFELDVILPTEQA